MQVLIVLALAALSAAAPQTFLTRAPAFDSAVIKSDRLGGNFAYSVAENHAYAAHTPIVQNVASPVAVSYSAAAPSIHHSYAAPALAYNAGHAPAALAYNYGGYPYHHGYSHFGYNYLHK